jgi:hypothetical protein
MTFPGLVGTLTADGPPIGMCDSTRCPQAAHRPFHRPVWAAGPARLQTTTAIT